MFERYEVYNDIEILLEDDVYVKHSPWKIKIDREDFVFEILSDHDPFLISLFEEGSRFHIIFEVAPHVFGIIGPCILNRNEITVNLQMISREKFIRYSYLGE